MRNCPGCRFSTLTPKRSTSAGTTFLAGLLSSIVAVVVGALGIVAEAALSGSILPAGEFLGYMFPTHIAIGVGEGLITGAILALVAKREPALLDCNKRRTKSLRTNFKGAIAAFSISALLIGGGLSMIASERPDGLEWSIEKSMEGGEFIAVEDVHRSADALQENIAVAPDYEGNYTGLIATASLLLLAWVGGSKRKKEEKK